MKPVKRVALLSLLLCLGTYSSHGQFLKKLANKAQKAAERTVERRVQREASKKTDRAIDSVFKKKKNKNAGQKAEPNKSYVFNSKYVMEITTDNDTMPITYFFGSEDDVMATSTALKKNEEVYALIDLGENKMHSLMNLKGQKSRTTMQFSPNEIQEDKDLSKISVSPNGQSKTILGYDCKGYDISAFNYHGTVWVAENSGATFPEKFKTVSIKNSTKKGVNPQWMSLVAGIPLEMDMVDTSRKKPQKVHMLCTEIGSTDLVLDLSEYKGIIN